MKLITDPADLPSEDVGPVALDTETSGLHPDDGARVACLALAWEGGSAAFPFDQGVRDKLPTVQLDLLEDGDPNLGPYEWEKMVVWLEGRDLVMHNGKFDLTMMRTGTRHWKGVELAHRLKWDTMLASGILEPKEPRGLDAAAKRAGVGGKQGLAAVKQWLKARKYKPTRYDLVPWSIIQEYVTVDAEMTLDLYLHQRQQWRPEYDREMELEMDLLGALYRMEARGVQYDAEESLRVAELLERKADEIESRMPFKCDVTSAKRYFFDELLLPPDRRTEKGAPSLDEEQIRDWVKQGVEWAEEYSDVSRMRRAVSMWYQGYPDKLGADGRLRCTYRQGHVKSGRMSVERVQLQAMPKADKSVGDVPGVRDLLQAKDGHGLWSLDLSQAELRVAAKYSGCQTMLDELAGDSPDIHGRTCEQVLGVSRDDPQWKEKRDIAKRLTFGSIFQIGGQRFQATMSKLAGIHMPLDECQALVDGWRRMYPEFTTAYRKSERLAKSQGWVPLLPGTEQEVKSWFGPRDWPHTAWNRIVQGSLAQFFKMWMVAVDREFPGRMILTIHDSVLLELPLDEGDEVAARVAAQGTEIATDLFMRGVDLTMPVDTDRWG